MADWIIEAVLGWAIKWLTGWQQRRRLAKETVRADQAEAKVQADEQVIAAQKDRTDVDQKVLSRGADAAVDDMRQHWNEP